MNLPVLAQDKANHVVYGAAVTAIVSCHSMLAGAAVCVFFAVGKEVFDWWQNKRGGNHGVEFADTLATLFGGALVLLPQFVRV